MNHQPTPSQLELLADLFVAVAQAALSGSLAATECEQARHASHVHHLYQEATNAAAHLHLGNVEQFEMSAVALIEAAEALNLGQ